MGQRRLRVIRRHRAYFHPLQRQLISAQAERPLRLMQAALHTCAILDNGELKCWGADNNGMLGDGTTTSRNSPPSTPIDFGDGRTAVAVSLGGQHTCAILDDGSVKCWGYDNMGQLGTGTSSASYTTLSPSTPVDMYGTSRTAVAISSGGNSTCAILDNGDATCWGQNTWSALGTHGPNINPVDKPTRRLEIGWNRTVVEIHTSGGFTCAILDNSEMSCWGYIVRTRKRCPLSDDTIQYRCLGYDSICHHMEHTPCFAGWHEHLGWYDQRYTVGLCAEPNLHDLCQ